MNMQSVPLAPGRRLFYAMPKTGAGDQDDCADVAIDKRMDGSEQDGLLSQLRKSVVGHDAVFIGPFGFRKVVYCDYVASGRSLKFIETFLQEHVLPMYGNTHTTTSVTSLQSTMFRHEARDIIRNAVRASEHDAVIFTGDGATGAVHKLINAMNFTKPPIIFCGPFEHHSNLLPWREKAAQVVNITEDASGKVNMYHLELALSEWGGIGLPMIGCFSAASNITGQISDTIQISKLLHRYGALAFWDYATAAPYVDIDMHPIVKEGDASKDAVFISPHKFIGGVETPGVLVAARKLFKNPVPTNCGGGSVFFVSDGDHRYLQDEEAREEGGTPNIVGSIRAGLIFKLKQDIGSHLIMKRENYLYWRAMKEWKELKNLEILGPPEKMLESAEEKLAIFSFMIRHPQSGLYLHYSFVAALLNDVFGIQVRGGCACAGPYAQRLLGIDRVKAKRFEKVLLEDSRLDRTHLRRRAEYSSHEVLRPGFVRLNLPFFMSDEDADLVISAVKTVAESAWTMLPSYMFNPETGEWRHIRHQVYKGRKWLSHVKFTSDGMLFGSTPMRDREASAAPSYATCLQEADSIFGRAAKVSDAFLPDHCAMFGEEVGDLCWFLTPSEAQKWLLKLQGSHVPAFQRHTVPFIVRKTIKQLSANEIANICQIPSDVRKKVKSFLTKNSDIVASVRDQTSGSGYGIQEENIKADESIDTSLKGPLRKKEVTPGTNGQPRLEPVGGLNAGIRHTPTIIPSDSDKVNAMPQVDRSGDGDVKVSVIKFISPPKRLFKLTVQAIEEFHMINDGDRILVCLSGGKDSLSLLHTLRQYQFYAKKQAVSFTLGAVTVDPQTASYDPSPLIQYLAGLGLPYFYETQAILDQALALPELTSICAFCSRMKRGRLYNCARREGWNVLAMGQHLDDLAESFLMSAFQNGLLRTMKANYLVQEGDLRVIRPFVYVREKDTREFAESSKLPIIPENCPACFEAPKERHRMKQLLASQEIVHPKLFYSLKEALLPLMSKNKTGIESHHILRNSMMDDE